MAEDREEPLDLKKDERGVSWVGRMYSDMDDDAMDGMTRAVKEFIKSKESSGQSEGGSAAG
ncbi:MAG TPA: hypothetical protein VG713_06935 [Pirellulales bacterium]|nr:hypothetical protein [Pirellulales bacterium]